MTKKITNGIGNGLIKPMVSNLFISTDRVNAKYNVSNLFISTDRVNAKYNVLCQRVRTN